MKVAIVCDWLTVVGGAEKVLFALHEIYPGAPIFTTVYNKKKFPKLQDAKVITSFLQYFPFARSKYPYFLPLMPKAVESFNLSDFDLVISSSHSCAKGVKTTKKTLHICYCHTPTRYLWQPQVDQRASGPIKSIFLNYLKNWDKAAADKVDYFLANSVNVQKQILKYYDRESVVLYPPVDTQFFKFNPDIKRENFFLFVSRLIPYKRADLAIEAFGKLKLPLKIVGKGPQMPNLRKIAKDNIEFLGHVSDEKLKNLYQTARALIFPAEEDFGIVPVEAQSTGCPVIAYKKAGTLESISEGKTGLFFEKQEVKSLIGAVKKFESTNFNPQNCRRNALRFSKDVFKRNFVKFVEKILK